MKTLLILTLLSSSFSQAVGQTDAFFHKLLKERVPSTVLTSVEQDYPGMEIVDVSGLPVGVMDNTWYLDPSPSEVYGSYLLTLSGKGTEFKVTYDDEGNLLNSTEQRKNTPLPAALTTSIKKMFPGWTISRDHLLINHYAGKKQKTSYRIFLQKGDEFQKVIFDANGKLLNGKTRK